MDKDGTLRLRYYKSAAGHGNFGDELSPLLVQKLSGRKVINGTSSQERSLIAIGSYIGVAKNNDIIWGSGVRTVDQSINYKTLDVRAIRGPLTKKYLENLSINVPNVFGDPGLLYAKLFDVNKNSQYENIIGIIPHYTLFDKYKSLKLPSNTKIISPTDYPNDILGKIKACKYIISSSLHGLIMADAYNVPNYWLNNYTLNEGTFKFEDYFASQNRQIKMHTCLESIFKSSSENSGNKIDLEVLQNVFPKELIKI